MKTLLTCGLFLTSKAQDSWRAESAAASAALKPCSAGLLSPGQGTWPDTASHTGWADQMLTGHPVPAADCNGGVTVNPSEVFGTCSHNNWEAHAKQCNKVQVEYANTVVWLLSWCMCWVGQPARTLLWLGGAGSAPQVSFDNPCWQPTCSCQCCT